MMKEPCEDWVMVRIKVGACCKRRGRRDAEVAEKLLN